MGINLVYSKSCNSLLILKYFKNLKHKRISKVLVVAIEVVVIKAHPNDKYRLKNPKRLLPTESRMHFKM